jgi:hypothetical protein
MRKILTLVTVALLGATAFATLVKQNQKQESPKLHEQHDKSAYPVAEYGAADTSDPKRKARKQRNNIRLRPSDNVDAKQFRLTESSESSWGGPPSHAPAEPALPTRQSDVVLVGEVTDAKAFLSEDETNVYSEFTVLTGEVLKNTSPVELAPGDSIITTRAGGAVRFPSGKVIQRGMGGRPFPRVQRRYVFFLKYDAAGQDYPIITAYELREGLVTPLDGLDIDGRLLEPYAAYQQYKGVDETTFIGKVREAINTAPTQGEEVQQ